MNNIQLKKLINISLLIVFIIFVIVAVIYLPRVGKVRLEVVVVPEKSTITLNDQPIQAGVHYLDPGIYVLKASYTGYIDDTRTVNLQQEPTYIALLPEANSADAKKFLANNPDIQSQREALAGYNANTQGAELRSSNPVIEKLPYIDPQSLYAIDYGVTDTSPRQLFLVISNSSPEGRQNAITWLKGQNVNINTTDIRYGDYKNPLVL